MSAQRKTPRGADMPITPTQRRMIDTIGQRTVEACRDQAGRLQLASVDGVPLHMDTFRGLLHRQMYEETPDLGTTAEGWQRVLLTPRGTR